MGGWESKRRSILPPSGGDEDGRGVLARALPDLREEERDVEEVWAGNASVEEAGVPELVGPGPVEAVGDGGESSTEETVVLGLLERCGNGGEDREIVQNEGVESEAWTCAVAEGS